MDHCICGLIGLAFALFTFFAVPDFRIIEYKWLIGLLLAYSLIIFLPYAVVNLFWIIRFLGFKQLSAYDEKQKNDLIRAGFTSWILSVPIMLLFFIINLILRGSVFSILWFLFYLFLNLFLFSFITLLFYKKDI